MMKKIFVYLFLTAITQAYSQTQWTKDPNNPVLRKGSSGEWDSHVVENPYVLFDGTAYHLWYAGSDGSGGLKIGYAYSSDGINWTKYDDPATTAPPYAESDPVLIQGSSGSWDAGHVLQPSVFFDGTTYHMWYGGTNGDLSERHIGYATSTDRIHWTKYSGNPVMVPGSSGSWDDVWVDSPNVLFINGIYHIWYCGFDGTYVQTGYATSADGISWNKDALNPVLVVGPSGSWDNFWVYQPSVVTDGVKYHMWYSGGGSAFTWRIGYAVSFDGINWTKYNDPTTTTLPYAESDPVINTGSSGSWDDTYVGQSSVITNTNSSGSITGYKMWYGGGPGFSNGEIGYATLDDPLPVELTSFTAIANGKKIILNWSTATEINNHGFEIQRSTSGKEFSIVGFIDGYGTTSEQHNYSYADKNLNNGKYFYRLKQVDFDGSYEYSNVVEVELKTVNSYLLEQNYPNPFNPATTIRFGVPEKSNVKITVLNSIGEQVALISNESKEPGFYQVEFNAANLPSGVYFYRLQSGSFVETKKMILMK
jgi:predicted GH43/DUF377 family glycosyl hydrolase